jgi:hypothetical protein
LDTFPYKVTYNIWAYVLSEYGRGWYAWNKKLFLQ